jgi:bifunctional NMN adenylyltransferase/nudix hydrolase
MKKFDFVVYIGRFQPFHNGHLATVQFAQSISNRVIVVCGSANQPRTIKNPFTVSERGDMIDQAVQEAGGDVNNVFITAIGDKRSNQLWVQSVVDAVEDIVAKFMDITKDTVKIAIIGHGKDETSFYLDMFPQWDRVEMTNIAGINATQVREEFLTQTLEGHIGDVPPSTYRWLLNFAKTKPNDYNMLIAEHAMIASYKQSWAAAPYPPTFVTADAVVVQAGHVLLIKRRSAPGAGLLALAGGFVNQNETIEAAMIRELREETKIKVPEPVLRGNIKAREVYDNPSRSLRGRTITHAFLIELPPGPLPKVKGSDDAAKAMWVPLSELDETKMFEDHYAIIQHLVGLV